MATAGALRVAIVAPGPDTEGGITEVVRQVMPALENRSVSAVWISSHRSGSRMTKAIEMVYGLWRAVREFRTVDVVHIHSSYWISCLRKSLFLWLARLWRKPVIWHLHVPDRDFLTLFCGRGLMARYARWTVERCALIVVLSERWRSLVSELFPSLPIAVIYNPAVSPAMSSSVRTGHTVLFLGHLIPRKGYEVLLRAFSEVAAGRPDWRLVFGGSGEIPRAQQIAVQLGIEDRVVFKGWVRAEVKAKLMDQAAIFVLPSHQEGLPMSVLEAMASRVPVIATPVGGIPDVIENGVSGLLVPCGEITALSDALAGLMDDADVRVEIGEAGQRAVRNFQPRELSLNWVDAYRSALIHSGGRATREGRA